MRPKCTLDQLGMLHQNAARAVKTGELTIREAAAIYGVSHRAILRWKAMHDRISINHEPAIRCQGRKSLLSNDQLLAIKTDLRSSIFRGSQKKDGPAGESFRNVRRYLSDNCKIHCSRSHVYRIMNKLRKGCF
jgi:transposase